MKINIDSKIQAHPAPAPVIRTDPTKFEFSYSSLTTAECPRKFYISKILKLNYPGGSVDTVFGSAMHEGVAQFYLTTGQELQARKLATIKAFMEAWKSGQMAGSKTKNAEQGVQLLNRYVDYYHDDGSVVEEVEKYRLVDMPNGTKLGSKLDRLEKSAGFVIVDTKTTGGYLTPYFFKKYENSFQLLLYGEVILRHYGIDYDSVLVDAISTPSRPDGKHSNFVRRTFCYTELQRKEALRTYIYKSDILQEKIAKILPRIDDEKYGEEVFPCNQRLCADWGGCPYLSLCMYGLQDKALRAPFSGGATCTH